jgi:TonB-linked SusC/RagA family outer membrane protein
MFYMKKNFLNQILFGILCISSPLVAQDIVVTGTVTDAEVGETLPDVNILVKGTSTGVNTDIFGKYSLKVNANQTLIFKYVGYKEQEIAVNSRQLINVILQPQSTLVSEFVVVGYGVQKKSQITGAIVSIQNRDFKDQPVSNLAGSIQGRVSGMNVTVPSGTPGAGLLVNVRGNNGPLYVVDGIPLLSESQSALSTSFDLQGKPTGSGQTLSSVSDINPNDIESVEVLKDASAAAIYGARAANGVVLITTKRGKAGKTEMSLTAYMGVQKVGRMIEFMSAAEMRELVEEARKNDLALYNKDNTIFGADFDPNVLTAPLSNFNLAKSANTDWLRAITQTAPIRNYEFSMRGGNEKTRFFTSAGYFDQTGIVIENYYKRFNYRLNLDHNVSDKFIIGANISATYSKNRRSFNDDTYTGVVTNALGASPFMPVYESDGSYSKFENYESSWLSDNPVKSAKEIRAFTTGNRFLGTAYGEYSFAKNLKFKTSFSTDVAFSFDNQFKSALTSDAAAVSGEAHEAAFRNLTWLNENILTYNTTVGKNNWSLLGGITEQRTQIERSSATGQGFPPGGLERISSAATISAATSTGSSFALLSFLGRVNYDYAGRYLLTATLRADGSSRFPKDNRFGYFPSASVAWRLSQESFYKNKWFTDVKVRASYGLTGDQEIGDFQNRTFYMPSKYNGQAGIMQRNIADPNLSWQINRMLNFGVDFEIKGGVISGSVEFFKSNKTRLLSENIVRSTTGFSTVTQNDGNVQNTGAELNLTATLVKTSDWKWMVNFNTTFVKNEIKSWSRDSVYLNAFNDLEATHILRIGSPIGSFYGLKYLGVDPQTGNVKFADTNGDGVIDLNDSQVIGKAAPSWFGGLTNTVSYKNFDLNIFLRYVAGNQVYNIMRSTTENLGYGNDGGVGSVYANNTKNVVNRWKKPGDVAEYGRASFVLQNYAQNSSQYIEDGAFLRVQNVNLGYTIKNLKVIDNVRVYIEAQNLYVFTKYKGFDPEVSSNGGLSDRTAGIDWGTYPQARTILFGANLKF